MDREKIMSADYIIIGLGAGYYVIDGLELGLDGEAWLGGDPDIYKLSPQAKYILPTQSRLRPYVGAFYNHSFIDHYDDLNTIGGRGGVYFMQDEQWFVGVGVVYESYLNCDEKTYSSCDDQDGIDWDGMRMVIGWFWYLKGEYDIV